MSRELDNMESPKVLNSEQIHDAMSDESICNDIENVVKGNEEQLAKTNDMLTDRRFQMISSDQIDVLPEVVDNSSEKDNLNATVLLNSSVEKPYMENVGRHCVDNVKDVIISARNATRENYTKCSHPTSHKDEGYPEKECNNGDSDMDNLCLIKISENGPSKPDENTSMQKETLANNDDIIEADSLCGFGCFKPRWIQKWATPKMYLLFFCLLNVVYGTYYNYFVGMLSTFEKRYGFKSKVSTSLMLAEEIIPLMFGILVGYVGGKTHRPRLVALGTLLSGGCCLLTSLPYFIYGSAKHMSLQNVENESGAPVCKSDLSSCDLDERPPTMSVVGLLLCANFLRGLANITLNIVGLSYMDDNTKKKNTPMYLAISFALRLFGPLLGYLLSSICLKFYENPFEDPGYGPEDPRWIGAWWIGFLVQSVLLVMCSIPIAMFPRKMPGGNKSEYLVPEVNEKRVKDTLIGLASAVKRMVKNPVIIFMSLSTIMKIFGHFGHAVMLPKYIENQFRFSASDANLYSGATSIACIMISTILGGLLIWKYRPSIKILLVGMITSEIALCLGFLVLMLPSCGTIDLSHFGTDSEGFVLNGVCNENCGCTTTTYNPYCGPDGKTTYFSPCYAGCEQQQLPTVGQGKVQKIYGNCSCVFDEYGESGGEIAEGYCDNEDCWTQALVYIGILLALTAASTIFSVAHTMILLRSVHPSDKSVALGIFESSLCLFGFIPFPPAFGALVDSACLVWEKSCDQTGNCWFYDMEKYDYLLHGVASCFCFFSALCLICLYKSRDRVRNLYEEELDDQQDYGDIKLDTVSVSQTKL